MDLHLDLEMTGAEYRDLQLSSPELFSHVYDSVNKIDIDTNQPVESSKQIPNNSVKQTPNKNKSDLNTGKDPLAQILEVGKKNLQCLDILNQQRPVDKKFQLSTPETQKGIPITQPSFSNRKIILSDETEIKSLIPAELLSVLWKDDSCPVSLSMSDEEYLTWARKVDRLYQNASRWILQEPYLMAYAGRSNMDIRGYYFLSLENNLETSLTNFSSLPLEKQNLLITWLVGLCHNSDIEVSQCQSEIRNAIVTTLTTPAQHTADVVSLDKLPYLNQPVYLDKPLTLDKSLYLNKPFNKEKNLLAFYKKYLPAAKKVWNDFFTLRNPRPEVYWERSSSGTPQLLVQNFQKHKSVDVRDWLKFNLEDEWHWKEFQLKVGYKPSLENPQVIFEAGVTPHVNGLGGDTIYMDANRDIQEYSSRWIIRHEYGHVLGLPDCYIEFYDMDQEVMINYQIDIDNLMCSRRGHLQEKHVTELQRSYRGK
jgi:hypothetical protein